MEGQYGLLNTPGQGRGRGRPVKGIRNWGLGRKLEDDLSDQIDQYLKFLETDPAYKGLGVSKADAIRRLIMLGLEAEKGRM